MTEGTDDTPLTVTYSYSEGVLLEGSTRAVKDRIKAAYPRWRWFRSLGQWGVARTRDRVRSRFQVEQYAEGLRRAGFSNVTVEYEQPEAEDLRDFGEVAEERHDRALARADRREEQADKHDAEALRQHQRSRAAVAGIPLGQPILVGHHSEKRHRRDLDRSWNALGKAVAADKAAKTSRQRARGARAKVASERTPSFALRRLKELAAELRKLDVLLTGEVPKGWRGQIPRGPATGDWRNQLLLRKQEAESRQAHYRGVLSEEHTPVRAEDYKAQRLRRGDPVVTEYGSAALETVGAKRARVLVGGRWGQRKTPALGLVWVLRSVLAERGGDAGGAVVADALEVAEAPVQRAKLVAPTLPRIGRAANEGTDKRDGGPASSTGRSGGEGVETSVSGSKTNDPKGEARLEYVDAATGRPAKPSEPGTVATGRIVAEVDGESVEVDPEDLVGFGSTEDPRDRKYEYDAESPADYPGQARAMKAKRKKAQNKPPKARRVRKTFASAPAAAKIFYDNNASFFDSVADPWDGLRDWMDGIEVRSGKGHKKLAQTPAGKRILGERHAAAAIRRALAYLFGKAKRRWGHVPWSQVERLEAALVPYVEQRDGAQPGLTWRPFTGEVKPADLHEMSGPELEAVRLQESAAELGEQLEALHETYDRTKECLPARLRELVERRIAEWSRWRDDPTQIPEYACAPDAKSGGYLCDYPSIAGELAELRQSCEGGYDPAWASKQSQQGEPGFPDARAGEHDAEGEEPVSVAACCAPAKKAAKAKGVKPATGSRSRNNKRPTAKDRTRAKKHTAWSAARRRAHRAECAATAARAQVKAINLATYRKRVETTKRAHGRSEREVEVLVAELEKAREAQRAVSRSASAKEKRSARKRVEAARCALRVAKGRRTQHARDHRRAETELRRATARLERRREVARARDAEAKEAGTKASALKPGRR